MVLSGAALYYVKTQEETIPNNQECLELGNFDDVTLEEAEAYTKENEELC